MQGMHQLAKKFTRSISFSKSLLLKLFFFKLFKLNSGASLLINTDFKSLSFLFKANKKQMNIKIVIINNDKYFLFV